MKISLSVTIAALATTVAFAAPAQAGHRSCGFFGCNNPGAPMPAPTPTPTPTAVPEPSDAALLLIGVAGVAFGRWQQRRKS